MLFQAGEGWLPVASEMEAEPRWSIVQDEQAELGGAHLFLPL